MITLVRFTFFVYRVIISPILKNVLGTSSFCRYSPSCSAYSLRAFEKYGMITGCYLSIKRFLRCNPFVNSYDRNI